MSKESQAWAHRRYALLKITRRGSMKFTAEAFKNNRFMKNDFKAPHHPVRSAWKESLFVMRGRLTDKAIERYERQGYYTPESRQARASYRKAKEEMKRKKREGNFLVADDGRLIYSP